MELLPCSVGERLPYTTIAGNDIRLSLWRPVSWFNWHRWIGKKYRRDVFEHTHNGMFLTFMGWEYATEVGVMRETLKERFGA